MNNMIPPLIPLIAEYTNKWHLANLDIFEFKEVLQDPTEHNTIKLLYHNYQIWHFIELYMSPDSNIVLYVYDGGIKHNKLRNDTIEALDVLLCKHQKGTGKMNSETIGSIIDRIGILSIKEVHLTNDKRLSLVQSQKNLLINCAVELMDEMISGERRCVLFDRFKIEYSGQ
jgi:hypothetical protein